MTHAFLALAAVVLLARLLGALATRYGQPSILGELAAGVVLGPSLFALVDPSQATIQLFAQFGVFLLLFDVGLHTNLGGLLRVGSAATTVALVGVVLPMAGGTLVAEIFGLELLPSLVCGAALTATSISISARVLGDLNLLESAEGRVVLGAAVLDDVMGLVILAIVAALAAGGTLSAGVVVGISAKSIGFLVAAILIGRIVAPRCFALLGEIRSEGLIGAAAVAFALALAAGAEWGGSAAILGALAAGLVLHPTPQRPAIQQTVKTFSGFFAPVFFATVGAMVDLRALGDPRVLALGGALLAVGIAGKVAAGYAPRWVPLRYAVVGAAMVPRGEVGLIFAQMGLAAGVLGASTFGALMLMVVGTTFVTPPWLAWLGRRDNS